MKLLRSLSLSLAVLAGAVLLPARARAGAEAPLPTSPILTAIENAEAQGRITEPQALLYKLYAVYSSPKLPAEFRSPGSPPIKCGTAIVQDARQHLDTMPEGIRREVQTYFTRPNLDSYIDTAHYRIHYATSGPNVIYGWPNTSYRDSIAATCEHCWSFYHDQHGWPAPPPDGANGGGSNLIDCYVLALTGAYGITFPEDQVPGGYPNEYTAYFEIDCSYQGFGYATPYPPMKVTVAHEYHHVVQMGLNAVGSSPWMEQTSTNMEEQVYDAIDDNYQYIPYCLGAPWNSLRTTGGIFQYGAFLWPNFLMQKWDHSLVRDVWTEFATNLSLSGCFNDQLQLRGDTYDAAMAEWARWNTFTYARDDGHHYREGAAYRTYVNVDRTVNVYPVTGMHPSASQMPQGTGTNYTYFLPQSGSPDNKIEIDFAALGACDDNHVISFVRKFAGQPVWEEYVVPVDGSGHASFSLLQWDRTDYLFMVTEMKNACGDAAQDFQFNAQTSQVSAVQDPAGGDALRLDPNEPNPFRSATTIPYALAGAGPVRIDVFDASGRRVRTLVNGSQAAGEHKVLWLGAGEDGRAVAPGVYFYSVRAGNRTITRKMLRIE